MHKFFENALMVLVTIIAIIAAIFIGIFGVGVIFMILGFICVALLVAAIVVPIVNGMIELLDYLERKSKMKRKK